MKGILWFKELLEKIPSEKWTGCSTLGGKDDPVPEITCVMGHLGGYTKENSLSKELSDILREYYQYTVYEEEKFNDDQIVYCINDNNKIVNLSTPKKRVMFAINFLIEKQNNKSCQKSKNVALVEN